MGTAINARMVVKYAVMTKKQGNVFEENDKIKKNLIQNSEKKIYNGKLSIKTKSIIKTYAANMILVNSKARNSGKKQAASFVTLTLPSKQIHEDNEIKRKILQPFLAECKRIGKLKYYIWTAETQENGNLHFHIITPTYIQKEVLQERWNKHTETLGYISRCSVKNPPSTHIKGVRETNKAIAYISKYMSKECEKRRKVKGRLWGCDTETEKLKSIKIDREEFESIKEYIEEATTMEINNKYFLIRIIDIDKNKKLRQLILSKLLKLLAK